MENYFIGAMRTKHLAALRRDLVDRVVVGATFSKFALVPFHSGGPGLEPSVLGVLGWARPFQAMRRGPLLQ